MQTRIRSLPDWRHVQTEEILISNYNEMILRSYVHVLGVVASLSIVSALLKMLHGLLGLHYLCGILAMWDLNERCVECAPSHLVLGHFWLLLPLVIIPVMQLHALRREKQYKNSKNTSIIQHIENYEFWLIEIAFEADNNNIVEQVANLNWIKRISHLSSM